MRDQYHAATHEAAKQVYDAYVAFHDAITAYIQRPSFVLHGHPEDRRIDIETAEAISDWHRQCDRTPIGDAISVRKAFYANRPAAAPSPESTRAEARDEMIKAFDAAVDAAQVYYHIPTSWDLWSETEASVANTVDNRIALFVAGSVLDTKIKARDIAEETRRKLLDEPMTRGQMFDALKALRGGK